MLHSFSHLPLFTDHLFGEARFLHLSPGGLWSAEGRIASWCDFPNFKESCGAERKDVSWDGTGGSVFEDRT